MTVQKKILDLTGTQYLVQKITGEIPVKISDLQDDVSLGTHIADTDIHVTTADKNRWDNNTYVFRYSSTVLVASSTNSNTLLDNTDNLKVGDKVIDSSGVLFSITAIDTQNSTFTIGTALIDLAQDSDVVHKSGNETVEGYKVFENISLSNSIKARNLSNQTIDLNNCYSSFGTPQSGNISFYFCNTADGAANISNLPEQRAFFLISQSIRILSSGTVVYVKQTLVNSNGKTFVRYCTNSAWGSWQNVTNLVTTDTAQTISGSKTFSSAVNVYNSDSSTDIASIILKNQKAERGESTSDSQIIYFTDKLTRSLATIRCQVGTSGQSLLIFRTDNIDSNNDNVYSGFSIISYKNGIKAISPYSNGNISLGTSNSKWSNVQTNNVNSLEPSSLSLPSGNLNDVIDISSYLTNLDGTDNTYVAPANGWITINMNNCSGIHATITGFWGDSRIRASAGAIKFLMPVLKNQTVTLTIHGGTINNARFIPCQGNV